MKVIGSLPELILEASDLDLDLKVTKVTPRSQSNSSKNLAYRKCVLNMKAIKAVHEPFCLQISDLTLDFKVIQNVTPR